MVETVHVVMMSVPRESKDVVSIHTTFDGASQVSTVLNNRDSEVTNKWYSVIEMVLNE